MILRDVYEQDRETLHNAGKKTGALPSRTVSPYQKCYLYIKIIILKLDILQNIIILNPVQIKIIVIGGKSNGRHLAEKH